MNGHLSQRALSDVLADVQRRQASGVLRIQKDATTRQIFIDVGVMIRFAVSTLPGESITALFRDRGAVTDAQLRQLVLRLARVDLLRLRFRGYPSESFFVRVRATAGWRWFRRSNRRRRGDAGVDASAPDTMYPLW